MKKNHSINSYLVLAIFLVIFNQCKKEDDPLTVQDYDGNIYSTVQIGNQIWIAENLKTTKLNDGTQLTNIENPNIWVSSSEPGYCWFNNDAAANKNLYGGLYNFKVIESLKICPAGWHVPDDTEWNSLIQFLGGDSLAPNKLKVAGTSPWGSEVYE